MSYSTEIRICAMIPNLINSASIFDDITVTIPSASQLERWQTSGCSIINSRLAARGYGAVPTGATMYDWISDIESLYVAYRAERARSSPRSAAGERGRAEQLWDEFNDEMDILLDMDLSLTGLSFSREDGYVGGISESEKDSVDSDTDRVKGRFRRGQFESGEVPRPGGATADDQADRWK